MDCIVTLAMIVGPLVWLCYWLEKRIQKLTEDIMAFEIEKALHNAIKEMD